jgi:hypothetical protein
VKANFVGMDNDTMRFMPVLSLLLMLVIGLVGCATEQKVESGELVSSLQSYEDLMYESLSREAVPLPAATPYDPDTRKRGAYLRGFADAWHYVISGSGLHGDGAGSFYQSSELRNVWWAGYETGRKLAWERWKEEDLWQRKE